MKLPGMSEFDEVTMNQRSPAARHKAAGGKFSVVKKRNFKHKRPEIEESFKNMDFFSSLPSRYIRSLLN